MRTILVIRHGKIERFSSFSNTAFTVEKQKLFQGFGVGQTMDGPESAPFQKFPDGFSTDCLKGEDFRVMEIHKDGSGESCWKTCATLDQHGSQSSIRPIVNKKRQLQIKCDKILKELTRR